MERNIFGDNDLRQNLRETNGRWISSLLIVIAADVGIRKDCGLK